jgi:hypothetical protein
MSEDLEFHYVVSYREGYGWQIAVDVEDAVMTDGTIYDWDTNSWIFPSGIDSGKDIETLDLSHYNKLKLALDLLNEGAINA